MDELADQPVTADVIDRTTAHEGYVWDVVTERFRFGATELTRDFIDHPGAVAVLALDDEDRAMVIQQYRHPIRMRDWEIPAGLLDIEGEPLLAAAKRELAEEVDLAADSWFELVSTNLTPGGSNERYHVFLARDLRELEPFAREAEEAEIERRWVPLDDLVAAVLNGSVGHSGLIVAALAAAASREDGWSSLRRADDS